MRKRVILVGFACVLCLALAADAADVDPLLRLEQHRYTPPAGQWPAPGSVFAYA